MNKNIKFQSISRQLLKVVFAFYFAVTIIITLIHFSLEYYNTKKTIQEELVLISKTFKKGLETALWNFDTPQIKSIVQGIIELPTVLGVEIYDKNTKQIIYELYTKGFNKKASNVFSYKLDLFFDNNYVGTINYYCNSDIVFDRVKLGFYIIFINSIIKSIILTILFLWAFNRYLTRPLDKITKNIQKLDLHNLSSHQQIEYDRRKNNEITILSKAFNQMLNNLEKNLAKLQDTQKHLLQSEKMVALGGMVAGVAHEINTPVGMALTGITHLYEETKRLEKLYKNDEMTQEDFEEYLKTSFELNKSIQINLNKAAELVKSFKQVAVDQTSGEIRTFKLKEYINEILLSLHNKLKKTKIKVEVDIDENIIIKANPGHYSQIITNFVMNSLIHGFKKDEEGIIKIKAFVNTSDNLVIEYSDTGKGIPDNLKDKIFDPFFTTNREGGGSGLGMSIIYNLITSSLQGTITLGNNEPRGVKFVINVPIKEKS